jgi:hypothetical protein
MEENILEMGFSVSHEHDAGKLVKTFKNISVRAWVGESDTVNLVYLPDINEGYQTITILGREYINTKIIDRQSSIEDGQLYYTYELQQRIDNLDCEVISGLKISEVESFNHSVSTSRNNESVSYTRSFSIQLVDQSNYISTPESASGSALIDKAISAINTALLNVPDDFVSIDEDINDLIQNAAQPCAVDEEGRYEKNRNEQIDIVKCSVEISETTSKRISEDDCCITSDTIGLRWDQNGLVGININGSIRGACQKYSGCEEERKITKTKYDFALECFDEPAIREKIIEQYEKHQLETCETDVCLALRVTSKSVTHCHQAGTINFSYNAQEEEVLDKDNEAIVFIDEDTRKDGCIVDLTLNFDISAPVNFSFVEKNPDYLIGDCSHTEVINTPEEAIKKSRAAFSKAVQAGKFNSPEGFFGPLTFSMNECPSKGTIVGSLRFSNDLKYDVETSDSLIKKRVREETVCVTEIADNRFQSPCACPIIQKQVVKPGYTDHSVSVEAFPCATLSDLKSQIQIPLEQDYVLTQSSSSFNVQEGALSAKSRAVYHTPEDLNECR